MGLPALVRSLEELGRAQVDMRDIPDHACPPRGGAHQAHPPPGRRLHRRSARARRAPRTRRGRGRPRGSAPRVDAHRCPEVPPRHLPPRPGDSPARRERPRRRPAPAEPTRPASRRRRPRERERHRSAEPTPASGPELARRTLGAVRRQGAARPGVPGADAGDRRAGHGAHGTGRPPAASAPADAAVRPPGWRRSPPCRRATSSSRCGGTACSPTLPTGPGPGSGWALHRRRRGPRPCSPCPTRRTVPIARRSASRWRPRSGRTSGRRCPSGSWSTTRPPTRPRVARRPARPRPRRPPARRPPGHPVTAVAPTRRRPAAVRLRRRRLPDLLDPAVLAAETELAGAGLTPEERLKQAFPGAARGVGVFTGPLQALVDELGRLPGIGPKSAQRIAFHLLKVAPEDAMRLAEAIVAVKERITLCPQCFNVAEGDLVRHLRRCPTRRHRPVRRRGSPRHRGGGEDPGVPRPLPRPARRAESDRGHRARPAACEGAARSPRRRRRSPRSSCAPIPTSRARPPPCTWRGS